MPDSKGRIPVSVEWLVAWAYRDCLVHKMDSGVLGLEALEAAQDGILLYKVSGDGVAQCIERAHLGVKVDGGGLVPIRDAPADAKAVHRHVLTLDRALQRVVIVNGAMGCWPLSRVCDRALRVIPDTQDGKIRVYRTRGPAHAARTFCPIEIVDDTPEINRARELYEQWWYALFGMKAAFESRPDLLQKYRVVRQDAPRRPWARVGGASSDAVVSGGNPPLRTYVRSGPGIAA